MIFGFFWNLKYSLCLKEKGERERERERERGKTKTPGNESMRASMTGLMDAMQPPHRSLSPSPSFSLSLTVLALIDSG